MIGQGRPTISAWIAALVWLAAAAPLAAEDLRAPVDSLHVVANRDPLIFAPGEMFTFDLEPLLTGVEPSTTIDIATTLTPARGHATLWSTQQRLPVPVDGPAVATLHIPMPRQEGVYEIRLAVTRPPGFRERFFPGGSGAPLVERSFQVVVLDRLPATPASDAQWRTILEIDPANPTWWTKIPDWTQIRRIPGMSRRPLGSVRTTTVNDPLGVFVELPPTPASGEPHWQAYPMNIEAVGVPHLVEIEYPNDREQHLGISVVEPDASGRFVTISRDSGVYVEGLGAAEHSEVQKHRLVFWPRTSSPMLLVTNQHPTAAARFGRLRVTKRSSNSIAVEPWASSTPSGRLVAAYLARPIRGESPDDWLAYYEGASRLAEYLNYAGYNAAAINVMAGGGTIFPKSILETAPHMDIRPIGVEADIPTADGLELMFRVFDRCGLALVPALEFDVPLPELEALRQQSEPQIAGIELVGPGGHTWLEAHSTERGLTPHYNLLDDRVQRAMLEVVRQLVARYGRHRSFASLSVQLSGRGYAMLPGLEWGLDDTTIEHFERDTGIRLPVDGPNRFAVRQSLLLGEHADAWRAWRAARVTQFYEQLSALVATAGNQRRLLLTTEEMLAGTDLTGRLRPNVLAKPRLERLMLDAGVDWRALNQSPNIMVLPTRYVESMVPLVDRVVDLALNDAFAGVEDSPSAALFYHRPQRQTFASFDELGPFASHAQLVTQSAAHGAATRRPYVVAMVGSDPAIVLDGGEFVPLGQEDAARSLRAVLRALPTGPATSTRREQNVTVRTYDDYGQTVCVVINECPWQADVSLDVVASRPTDAAPLVAFNDSVAPSLTEHFNAGRQLWSLQLAPYDVRAVKFAAGGVRIEGVQSQVSETGRQELASKIDVLGDRDLRAMPRYETLQNPDFEPTDAKEHLPGWQLIGEPSQVTADLDATNPQNGKTCLYLQNRGKGTATIESNSFPTPPTGQLVMLAFVRGENVAPSSELRLVFETDGVTKSFRQFATLGGDGPAARPIASDWGGGFLFRSEDLPLDSRGTMRVKFELTGPGELWIDNVQLYDLLFPLPYYNRGEAERLEFVKLISSAKSALERGELAECALKLDGYWPRFLNAYTPNKTPTIATQPTAPPAAPPTAGDEQETETPSVGSRWYDIRSLWKR
jgi:hypothetical protein